MVRIKNWRKNKKSTNKNIIYEGAEGNYVGIYYKPKFQGSNMNWIMSTDWRIHTKTARTKAEAMAASKKV